MEGMESSMSAGSKFSSKFNTNFFKHVFDFSPSSKDEIFNILQYGFLTIIPLILVLKAIKNYVPQETSYKGTPTILIEVVVQLIAIFLAFWFIHRIVTFFPTYSGKPYDDVNYVNMLLPFMFLLLTVQTKLGAKVNILINRFGRRVGFKNIENMENAEETKESCSQQKSHSTSRADYLDASATMPVDVPRQIPNFNEMQAGPVTPLQNANVPGNQGGQPNAQVPLQMADPEPMAANGVLGGSFGSSW